MRKNSIKNTRINEEVMKELSNILRDEVKDPRIDAAMTSIVSVEVAPDLKTAKVYVSVLGDEEKLASTMKGLSASAGFIRRELAHNLNLRNTPELRFLGDRSIEYGVRMAKLIDSTVERDEANRVEDEE